MVNSVTSLVVAEFPYAFYFSGFIFLVTTISYAVGYFFDEKMKNGFLKTLLLIFLALNFVSRFGYSIKTKSNKNKRAFPIVAGSLLLTIIVALLIPEYRELARVEFDGANMNFKNSYGVMITQRNQYSDILEVSTEIGPHNTKRLVVSTLRGEYISSHITDEKTVNLVQTQILNELHSHGVQPLSQQR
jgi:cytochrome c oxidase subunit IV